MTHIHGFTHFFHKNVYGGLILGLHFSTLFLFRSLSCFLWSVKGYLFSAHLILGVNTCTGFYAKVIKELRYRRTAQRLSLGDWLLSQCGQLQDLGH